MKNSKVTIVADDLGNVTTLSKNNPEYGNVRVVQESVQFTNGWMRKKEKSALIPGFVEDLQSIGWKAGETLNGQIVVKESLEPFNENDPDRDLKYAFAGGPLCVFEDQLIYRRTFYTENMNDHDEFIQHTNTEEIRGAVNNSDLKPAKEEKPAKKEAVETVAETAEESDDDVSFDF